MSDQHEREQRDRKNREAWTDARMKQLRGALGPLRGRTISLDLSTPTDPLIRPILGRIEKLEGDTLTVTDLSDARVPPGEKSVLTIALASIRNWSPT